MTHLTRIMANHLNQTPYEVKRGANGAIVSRKRLRDTEYNGKNPEHVIEPNVVIRIALDRGVGSLAINLSEAILTALRNDPAIAAIWAESDALRHWEAINLANRAGRMTLKPDTASPAGAKFAATILPLDASAEAIKKAAEDSKAARIKALTDKYKAGKTGTPTAK